MKLKIIKVHLYHTSIIKRFFDFTFSLLGLIILSPIILLIMTVLVITSGLPIYFIQKRVGINGKVFKIIKFRTMQKNASNDQYKYKKLNEVDGPVFKIYNDPRFTQIGRILSRFGLDELPQLVNVIRGDMSLVGPRPLPVDEAQKLKSGERVRELIKPGITSMWVSEGSHKLSFKKWMVLDRKYVEHASFGGDIRIIFKTLRILV